MRLGQAEAAYGMALRPAEGCAGVRECGARSGPGRCRRSLRRQVRTQATEDVRHLVWFVGDLPVGEAQDAEARGGVGLVASGGSGLLGRACGGNGGRRSRRSGLGRGSGSRPRSRGPRCLVSGPGRPAARARGRNRTSRSESERRKVWRSRRVASFFTPGSPLWPSRDRRSVSGSTRSSLSASLTALSRRSGFSSVARSIRVWTGCGDRDAVAVDETAGSEGGAAAHLQSPRRTRGDCGAGW